MNHHILTFLIFLFFYKITETVLRRKDGLGFVTEKLEGNKNINIDLSYNNDKHKINLEFDNKNEKLDTPLIILIPTDKISPSELYGKYLKETENPENIPIKNFLYNIVNQFEPIEQKIFLNKFSDEINTHINFYKSFPI